MLFHIANKNVLTQFISKAKRRSDACILYLIYSLLGYNRQKMSTGKVFQVIVFAKELRRRNEVLFVWGKLLGMIKLCCMNVDFKYLS